MRNSLAEWILIGLGILLLAFILYGSWQYYFMKPQPEIHNTYTIMPGANATIGQQTPLPKQKKYSFYTGLWVGKKGEFGVQAGIIW